MLNRESHDAVNSKVHRSWRPTGKVSRSTNTNDKRQLRRDILEQNTDKYDSRRDLYCLAWVSKMLLKLNPQPRYNKKKFTRWECFLQKKKYRPTRTIPYDCFTVMYRLRMRNIELTPQKKMERILTTRILISSNLRTTFNNFKIFRWTKSSNICAPTPKKLTKTKCLKTGE